MALSHLGARVRGGRVRPADQELLNDEFGHI